MDNKQINKGETAARIVLVDDIRECFEISAHACICVPALCARDCHQGIKWRQSVRQKLQARTERVPVPLVGMCHRVVNTHVP